MQIAPAIASKYPDLEDLATLYSRRQGHPEFWEDLVANHLAMVELKPNTLVWEFKIDACHSDGQGYLSAGCIATVIDICSSFAVHVYEGKTRWDLIGVSTDLGVSYFSRVKVGETVRLECLVKRLSPHLGNIYTEVFDSNNDLCYASSHSKYSIDRNKSSL
ncbi:HotDog domain-containing protein [Gongronella butleri]|nr:HotDog domain-containing protein [Gongronella butleri]